MPLPSQVVSAQSGLYSIHGLPGIVAGNYVSSSIINVSATTGTNLPTVSIGRPFEGMPLELDESDLDISLDGSGGIDSILLPVGTDSIGEGFYSKPEVQILGSGTGAVIEAIIDQSDDTASIIGFEITSPGSGYDLSGTKIKIIPSVQSIITGDEAVVRTDFTREPVDNNITQSTYYIDSDIGGLLQGSGYVVAPRYLNNNYPHPRRLTLEQPQSGATTSRVLNLTDKRKSTSRDDRSLHYGRVHAFTHLHRNKRI